RQIFRPAHAPARNRRHANLRSVALARIFRCIESIHRSEITTPAGLTRPGRHRGAIAPGTAGCACRPGAAMRQIDYDIEQYKHYARGRALTEQQLQTWISAFGSVLPERRPLAGLDVGSGTGRFTPALARAFGPVIGVEPSVRMREIAQAQSRY